MSYSYHGRAWERQQCQQVANQIENQLLKFAQDANNIKVGQELSEFTLMESAFPARDRKIMGKWRSMKQEATLL